MRNFLLITASFFTFCGSNIFGIQTTKDTISSAKPDTAVFSDFDQITKINSSQIIARITRISNSEVFYDYPFNKEELSIQRKKVHQIVYSTGRIETFNPLAIESEGQEETVAWENVKLLDNKSQTDTLIEISDFDALYESSKMKISTNQLEENALTILKKKSQCRRNILIRYR